MTTTTPAGPVTLPLPDKYRAAIFAALGIAGTFLLSVQDASVPGTPFGGISWLVVAVNVAGVLAVFIPGHPLTKFVSGLAVALGGTLVEFAGNGLNQAETITLGLQLLGVLGVGLAPNPVKVVRGKVLSTTAADPAAVNAGPVYTTPMTVQYHDDATPAGSPTTYQPPAPRPGTD